MWKVLLLALWVTQLSPELLFGQEDVQQKAELAFRFVDKVGRYRLDESLVSVADSIKQPGARFALRICSKKSLPESIAIAAASPLSAYHFLVEAEGYDPERILLLRSEDCLSRRAANAATELWIVPQGATPPSSVESFKGCQVSASPMLTRGLIKNARDYRNALHRLEIVLRERPQALGIVNGFYHTGRRRPLVTVRQSLHEAQKFLKQRGIASNRYLVRIEPWNEEWSAHNPEPSYPAVYTIEVSKTCDRK
jgi:hypothetical protein